MGNAEYMGIVESQLLFNQEGDHFPVCLARHLHFSSLGWPTYHARLRLTPQPPLMLKLIPGMDTVDTMDTDHMDTIDPTVTDTGVERRGKLSPPLMLRLIPGMDTMAVTTDTDPTTDTTDTDTDTGVERRGKLMLPLTLPLMPKLIPGMDTMAVTTDTEDLMVTTDLMDMPTGVR